MKAVRLVSWQHDPEIHDVPEPDPGPGEVVVRIGGTGACHSDLHLLHEFPAEAMPFDPPFTLGHENAGWVDKLGDGVAHLEEGQPVAVYGPWGCGICRRCRTGQENYCERQEELEVWGGGLGLDGGMASHMLVPAARLLVPLGDLDPVEAAPLTDAALTPYHAVKRSLPLMVPGSTVVIIGVGGLGHMAVQITRALSAAKIIAVDQRADALKMAEEAGADHTVISDDDAVGKIRDLTDGRGADVIIDVVGADQTIALGVEVGRQLGHLTVVGLAGGSVTFGYGKVPSEMSFATTYWGSVTELREVLALAEEGRIKPHVQRFDLDEAPSVYEKLAAGEIAGRAVLIP